MTASMPQEVKNTILKKIPAGRFGEVQEIADVATFLARRSSGFINGAIISVNGGLRV